MSESVSPADAYKEARRLADEAKAALIARRDAIKAEKKSALVAWKNEIHDINEILGRTRMVKPKAERKPRKPKPGIEAKEQKA